MRKIAIIASLLVLFSICVVPSYSKRLPPGDVEPVSKDGIQYTKYGEDSIMATDTTTGKTIWTKQIYVVKYIPNLERDVQNCFISKIEEHHNKLIITNEKNYKYELDLNTLQVKVLKGSIVIGTNIKSLELEHIK